MGTSDKHENNWKKYADSYDPIKIGSIDGKPFFFALIIFSFVIVFLSFCPLNYRHR